MAVEPLFPWLQRFHARRKLLENGPGELLTFKAVVRHRNFSFWSTWKLGLFELLYDVIDVHFVFA